MNEERNRNDDLRNTDALYRSLGEICEIKTGAGITKNNGNASEKYPIISGGKGIMGYYSKSNRCANTITIARAGSAGYVNYITQDFYLNDKCFSIIPRVNYEDRVNSKFLYYYLKNIESLIIDMRSSGTVPTINTQQMSSIKIPLPPLEVQQEIVRILDTFTSLEAELEAELEARKKQYITYLDDLLKSKKDTPQVAIKDVVDIIRGVRVTKNQISNGGSFAVYQNSLAPMGYFDKFNFNENTTYIISAGAAGEIGFSKSKFWAADDCFVLKSERGVINKFVYYCLKSKQNILFSNVRRASIPRLSRNVVEDIKIPFFDIETQKRIVNILDHFDTLVNDLSQGLPAEITARRKQYKYYRNKLLTFKEVKHESV